MAERRAPVLVRAALGSGQNVTAILDGARPDQHMPVGLAGLLGKRSRDRDKGGPGLREGAIERRKAQVVADGEAQPAPWQVDRHSALARPEAVRLAIALAAGEVDVEHVDLVIARNDLA